MQAKSTVKKANLEKFHVQLDAISGTGFYAIYFDFS